MTSPYPIIRRKQTAKKYKQTELDWRYFRLTPENEAAPLHEVIIKLPASYTSERVIELHFADAVHGFLKLVKA